MNRIKDVDYHVSSNLLRIHGVAVGDGQTQDQSYRGIDIQPFK